MSWLSIYIVLLVLIALSSIHTNALRNLLEEHHEEEKPFHGGDKQPHDHEPSHSEDPRRHAMEEDHHGDPFPGHGREGHMPGVGGEGDRPGHGSGRGPPDHGKHKPPHKCHPPLNGVVHLSASQTVTSRSGKCPCGCDGDPSHHMPCACGCDGKSDHSMPCGCGCGQKPDKPTA